MNSFPKKYNPKDLHNRSNKYRENSDKNNEIVFFTNILSSSKKLTYRDFFEIYLNDFFCSIQYLKNKNSLDD
jgi:hypothetical protein